MITEQQIYWITRLDNLLFALLVITFLGILATVGFWIDGLAEANDSQKRKGVMMFLASALMLIGCAFIPSTKEMAAIIVLPKIVNNEKVQDAGNKLFDLAVEWLEDLKPGKSAAK